MKNLSVLIKNLLLSILIIWLSDVFPQQTTSKDNNCYRAWTSIEGANENIVTFHITAPAPLGWDPLWLQYDNGVNETGIGFLQEFSFASYWSPDQLEGFDNTFITKVKFLPTEMNTNFTLKIWRGTNGNNLVYSQAINEVISNEWNEIELASPIEIIPDEGIWVGFKVHSISEAAGAGLYTGNPNSNYVKFNGTHWQHLSDHNLDYSWNLGVYVEGQETNDSIYEFLGFNMYRDQVQLNNDLITGSYYWDTLYNAGTYSYYSTAVYDVCGETDPANIIYLDWSGFTGAFEQENHFNIYPNPVKDILQINASFYITNIKVYNSMGTLITNINQPNNNHYILNTLAWKSGIYFLEVYTNQQHYKSKIIVQH